MKNIIQVKKIHIDQINEYDLFKADVPMVIEDGCKKWQASSKWDINFFKTHYGEIEVPLRNYKQDPYQSSKTKSSVKILNYLEEVEKIMELAANDVPVYDCVVTEGDIVWFPPDWWHHVKNDTFTISVTENFVSSHHFLPFEKKIRSTLLRPFLNLKILKDSRYVDLEKRYINFLSSKAVNTKKLLTRLV